MEILMQLHGGGGSGGGGSSEPTVKTSAPGSNQVAGIDTATEDERQSMRDKLSKAKGRRFTDKTGGQESLIDTVKKALLGE